MARDSIDAERFLQEAVSRGLLRSEDADSCRRILAVLGEVDVELGVAEVARRKGWLDKEQILELKRALARRRIGRYEVLERLGSGGNGVVWRARDTRLGRIVALKVLARPRDPSDVMSSYVARFEREARAAVTLNHVNIVRGLDYGEADGYVYFAMEFVAGETAAERLGRAGRLPERDAVRITLQVVDALRYVQTFGLVHRDLKPDNLLLTPTGEVKVCDLGLAKPTLEEASRMASRGLIAGTPLYMAPEQVRSPDAVDWRTDVYGLGATLYHLLTGRPPFVPRPGSSVIQRHLEEPVVDPREHVLELSAGVTAVVLKMLSKEPGRRWASLDDLAADLSAVLDGRPPAHALELHSSQERKVVSVLAATEAANRRRRTPRRLVPIAAAVFAVVAAGAGALQLVDVLTPPPGDGPPPSRTVVGAAHPTDASPTGMAEPTEPNDAGAPSDPAAPTPPNARPDPGARALELARALDDEGASLRDRIDAFSFVAYQHAEHASGRAATERVDALRAELEELAQAELSRRLEDAAQLETDGAFGPASEILERFPAEFHGTDAHATALAEAKRIFRDGRAFVERAFEASGVATAEWRFDTAHDWLDRADAAGIPGYALRRSQATLELELAQLAHDTERADREHTFHLLAGRSLLASIDGHEVPLRDVTAAARADDLRTYRPELERLAEWVPLAEAAADAVRSLWTEWSAEGRRVALRTAGVGPRDVVGRASGLDGDLLLIGAAGEAPQAVPVHELRADFLVDALTAAGVQSARPVEDLAAALLLACRRPSDAASLGAPQLWVEAVRAVAVIEADAWIAAARAGGRSTVEVREELDRVLADVPWYGPAYVARARLLEGLGDLDGAIRDLELAIENADRHGEERIDLARILERRGRLADAEGHLRLFLDSPAAPDSARVAEATAALTRVEDARVDRVADALRRDARNALRRDRADEALSILVRVLELRPDDPWALLESGRLHARRGAVFAAYRVFRKLVDDQPDDRNALAAQRELAALERYAAGVPAGREAMEQGRAALESGDVDEAVGHLRTALRRSPFLVDAHLGLAEALLARGLETTSQTDLVAALTGASDALLLAPDFVAARFVRARAALALGDAEQALSDAEAVVAALADPTDALLVAGRALLELGRLDDAHDRMQEAFERRRHAAPVYWQALILERQGARREARYRLDFLYDELGGAPEHLRAECEALYLRLRD